MKRKQEKWVNLCTQIYAVEDALMMVKQEYLAKEIKDILEKTAYDSIIYVGVET